MKTNLAELVLLGSQTTQQSPKVGNLSGKCVCLKVSLRTLCVLACEKTRLADAHSDSVAMG